jgi:hypothetical protein
VSTDQKRLSAAAETKGKVQAAVILPDLPAECRDKMGRVYPKATEKPRNTQLRWEFAADAQDDRTERCAGFYDRVKQPR